MNPLRGILLKMLSVTVFVIMATCVKAAAVNVPPGETVFFRSFFAIPVIIIWLMWQHDLAHGLETNLEQCNISFNRRRGTLRGLHYQAPPHEEDKLVRCTMGALWDVAIDLRPDSPTYKQWVAETLSAENRRMFFIPKGFAHGFLTLEDDTEVFYQMSTSYRPEAAIGYPFDDPSFGIEWPTEPAVISDADRSRPPFEG